MNEIHVNALPLWQFDNLSDFRNVKHYVSGRRGGVSKGETSTLNLSYKVGDDPLSVKTNRELISSGFGIEAERLLFPKQTHSINVACVNESFKGNEFEDTDALVTNVPGLFISVMSADCVSVLFFDPIQKVVGAAHAGWKGTVGRIGSKTAQAMMDNYGSKPENIFAFIGPSISPEIYEVGSEVISAVEAAFGTKEGLVLNERPSEGKAHFDLWAANKRQLLDVGLTPQHIEVAGICTFKNSKEFFSARESKNQAGRFAAGIMLS